MWLSASSSFGISCLDFLKVYVVDKAGYDEFAAAAGRLFGGQFHHFPDLEGVVSKNTPVYSKSGGLEAGEYYVLIENTDFGDVSPPANFNNVAIAANVKIVVR